MFIKVVSSALVAAALLAGAAPTLAAAVDPGFRGTQLPADDDSASGALSLGFSANYFGTTYGQTYISNNGYITFGSGQTSYTPTGLGAGYTGQPIIAAFFADVDTRTAPSGQVSYGTGTYAGRQAFGATWPGVGYFRRRADRLNTFQIVLTDRSDTGAGNFDIYFNYDSIQWETGNADDGIDGLGGNSAAVGYNAGTGNDPGTYYEFAGSRVAGSFIDGGPLALATNSNDGVAGQYIFQVRNGQVAAPTDVPEPMSLAVLLSGFGAMGLVRRRAHRRAEAA